MSLGAAEIGLRPLLFRREIDGESSQLKREWAEEGRISNAIFL